MPGKTPRQVHNWAMRIMWCGLPLTAAALVVWAWGVLPLSEHGSFVIYHVFLLLTVNAGVVAAVTRGQLAIARAFTAGYNTGLAVSAQYSGQSGGGKHARPIPLRLVE